MNVSKTILVVEDNEDDVFALRWAFKEARITNEIQVVTDGQAAIDYLSGHGNYSDRAKYPLPFLVLLDLKLPYINGLEVLAWIKEQPALGSVVVVVLSSSDETRDHQRAYSIGARSYLVKPAEPQQIRDLIRSLESFWMRLEETPILTS
jgi:CheY-like chemotaxis protein